jgi:outer membrane protein assembly factor BamB
VIVHREGGAALWITARAHTVWADLISGRQTVALWRFDGAAAVAHRLSRRATVTSTETTYGDGSLWAVGDDRAGCKNEHVIRIDPSTGRETTIATVPVLDMCGGLVLEPSGLTFFKHAVCFLDGPRLYRVKP